MLLDHCLSCLSVCDVGVLWPKGWMDQDATWCIGTPRPSPHHVRWGQDPAPLPKRGGELGYYYYKRGTAATIFGPRLFWPNGLMDQDAT